jgi:hypothetical protein
MKLYDHFGSKEHLDKACIVLHRVHHLLSCFIIDIIGYTWRLVYCSRYNLFTALVINISTHTSLTLSASVSLRIHCILPIWNPTHLSCLTPRYKHTTILNHRIDCHVHQVDYWHYGFIYTRVICPLLTSDTLTCAPRHKVGVWCILSLRG